MSSNLKVAVRVRPFNQRENDQESNLIVEMDGKKTRLLKPSKLASAMREHFHDFTFDYSYWSFEKSDSNFTDQDTVFNDLGLEVVDCAFQGYNACVFAYGQTGSGKTFTMMGVPESNEMQGLVPRICKSLFSRIKLGQEEGTGYKTQVSYLEIYNEKVRDLLGSHNMGHSLRVREHKNLGPYVENLSQHSVSDFSEIFEKMTSGNKQRTTAATNMNDTSSRSHAIFTITFVQANYLNDLPSETISKIHLVDLAGSERLNSTGATGQRLKEGAHINKSLVTLGSVISSLAEIHLNTNNKRILYIPYRDSILTWLLKDSLGGNSKTIMIAAISPADINYSETLSTLRYANRAKNIVNKPTINEDPNVKLIRELRDEISELKNLLSQGNVHLKEPALKVLEDLQKKEAQEKVLTEEWAEKWREVQTILREEKSLCLKKSGVGVSLDSESPHLIGINDNITGVTLYSLKDGDTLIGTNTGDIVLTGMGILPEHCKIVLRNGCATIYPFENAQCWLNANLITQPMAISQGDIILLGRTNMFRYNNPAEHAVLKKHPERRSRMDISRLSLIAASRENLCSSFLSDDDTSSIFSATSSPFKSRYQFQNEQFLRDNQDIQDEHKKILETIENALKQLNSEKSQMHEHYKNKVRRFSMELERLEKHHADSMVVIDCRIEQLLAKQEMILWERNNEKTQVEIVARQITTLHTQLDSRKRDFYDYVAKELQELQDCGKLSEENCEVIKKTPIKEDYSDVLLEVSQSLDNFSSQYLRDNIKKNREEIKKFEEELEKKEKMLSEATQKIAEMDEKVHLLEKENHELLKQKSKEELEKLQLKKQSLSLSLKHTTANTDVQTDTSGLGGSGKSCATDTSTNTGTLETCDTFHTANSDCSFASALPSPFPGKVDVIVNILPTPSPSISPITMPQESSDSDPNESSGIQSKLTLNKHLMSDSGVCLEPNNLMCNKNESSTSNATQTQTSPIKLIFEDDNLSTNSSQTFYDYLLAAQMHHLCEKIAAKKADIMRSLEVGCNKEVLDEKINQLQELQRDYVRYEMRMQECTRDGCFSDSEMTADFREPLESIADSEDFRANPLHLSSYSTRNNSLTHSMISQSLMARSLPSTYFPTNSSVVQPEHFINITSYVLRGAGKLAHYEYEIKIYLPDARWSIFRRYSRFREFHLQLINLYGQKISRISFPRRILFGSKSERVARARRRQLENYLRRLLVVCSRIPQCPIFEGEGGPGLTKPTLIEFSQFFQKGTIEANKYGSTG